MEELYKIIEEKIKKSGYPGHIDGEEFFEDVSDEADEQGIGKFMFLIKKSDTLIYQGCMDIYDNQFDLHYVTIIDDDKEYRVNFDD